MCALFKPRREATGRGFCRRCRGGRVYCVTGRWMGKGKGNPFPNLPAPLELPLFDDGVLSPLSLLASQVAALFPFRPVGSLCAPALAVLLSLFLFGGLFPVSTFLFSELCFACALPCVWSFQSFC